MIVVILAGGYATRLWPVTKDVAKPLLPIGEKRIIDYVMEKLSDLRELTEVIVLTNNRFESQFRRWLEQRGYKNTRIVAERTYKEEEKLGSIRAVSELIPKVGGEDLVIIAGDNLFSSDLKGLVNFYKKKKSPVIALYDVGDLKLAKRYSTVDLDRDGKVVTFQEKPRKPKSSLVGTCIYIFPRRSLDRVHEYLKEGNPPDAFGYFTQWLRSSEEIYGYVLSGYWFDIGTPDSYAKAKEKIIKG